jgi:hypothetical protein
MIRRDRWSERLVIFGIFHRADDGLSSKAHGEPRCSSGLLPASVLEPVFLSALR